MTDNLTFAELGLSAETLTALKQKGFEEPTIIQMRCIPLLLAGKKDVVGQAQTGTGKTAAFGLPIIELIDPSIREVQALVITPTRELAIQVAEELNSLKGTRNLRVAPVYGGQSFGLQIKKIREGAQIVVGTPGRLLDHLGRKTLRLDRLSLFILDEADEMLNMGFIEDIEKILESAPASKRMLLFSATMPTRIIKLAEKYMSDYELVTVKTQQITEDLTDQIYFEVHEQDKFEALTRIIDMEEDFYGLIFCRTKIDVDMVAGKLKARDYDAEGIHGDITQSGREMVYGRFKRKKISILVATDVAARGLDVSDLTHVINYALPQDPENYIHRIGRTGRAGKQGTAVTFITPYEYRKLMFIQQRTKKGITKKAVPQVAQIIEVKKERINTNIQELIARAEYKSFESFAATLLEKNKPADVVAALLQHAFEDELDASNYADIRSVGRSTAPDRSRSASVDRKGKNRLFVAKGRQHGMNPQKLVQFITETAGVPSSLITDAHVSEVFSLISVPYGESEKIIQAFKIQSQGRAPMVREDRKDTPSGGGQRGGFRQGGYRGGGYRGGRGR